MERSNEKKPLTFREIFRWLVFAAVCVVIFSFSSRNAVQSSGQSDGIVDKVITLYLDDLEDADNAGAGAVRSLLSFVIRKLGHFSEFALLCASAFAALMRVPRYKLRLLFACVIGLVYACTDEIHQLFVPGRAGMISDVAIDLCGVIAGALFAFLAAVLNRCIKLIETESETMEEKYNERDKDKKI